MTGPDSSVFTDAATVYRPVSRVVRPAGAEQADQVEREVIAEAYGDPTPPPAPDPDGWRPLVG